MAGRTGPLPAGPAGEHQPLPPYPLLLRRNRRDAPCPAVRRRAQSRLSHRQYAGVLAVGGRRAASGRTLRVADRSGYYGVAAGVYGYPRHRHVCRRGRAGGRRNSAGGSSAGRRLSADAGNDFRRLGPSGTENGGGQDGHSDRHPDLPQHPRGGVYAAGYAAGGYLVLRQSRRDVAAGGGA